MISAINPVVFLVLHATNIQLRLISVRGFPEPNASRRQIDIIYPEFI